MNVDQLKGHWSGPGERQWWLGWGDGGGMERSGQVLELVRWVNQWDLVMIE